MTGGSPLVPSGIRGRSRRDGHRVVLPRRTESRWRLHGIEKLWNQQDGSQSGSCVFPPYRYSSLDLSHLTTSAMAYRRRTILRLDDNGPTLDSKRKDPNSVKCPPHSLGNEVEAALRPSVTTYDITGTTLVVLLALPTVSRTTAGDGMSAIAAKLNVPCPMRFTDDHGRLLVAGG